MKISNFKFQISNLVAAVVIFVAGLTIVPSAFAHVTVKPNQVGIGAYQTFTMSVPNEKDNPTIGMRLVIPEGLISVSPNVKPGWVITMATSGSGEEAKVTEITWSGGAIPEKMRDEFNFSAKTPSSEGNLQWKAYQTYQNGEVVAWDMDPNAPKPSVAAGDDEGGITPYSVTKVVNDLSTPVPSAAPAVQDGGSNTSMIFSIVALALSAASIGLAMRKK